MLRSTQSISRKSPLPARRSLVLAASILVSGALAVLPGVSTAAGRKTNHVEVTVNRGVLEHGRTVSADVVITDPQPEGASRWSEKTISTVVRAGVDARNDKPYASEGYRCTSVLDADLTRYDCTLHAADGPTSVALTFAARFEPLLGANGQFDFPITVNVIDEPAHQSAAIVWTNAQTDPFPTTITSFPTFNASAQSSLVMPRNGLVISSGDSPLSASLQTAVHITEDNSVLSGTATVPAGADLTVSVNHRPPVYLPGGSFNISTGL
jgi:hypothetical protein